MMISIKNKAEIEKMRVANAIVYQVLSELGSMIEPGISAAALNKRAGEIIKSEHNASAAFNGFVMNGLDPFPYNICASVNNEIVHGYATQEKILREGDIIGIDVGVKKNGFYGDGARTFPIGNISQERKTLLKATKLALERAIERCVVGNRLGDVSAIIEATAEEYNLFVANELTGHGIGRDLHEPPVVYNFGKEDTGPRLKAGMTIAIEPMFNVGTSQVKNSEWIFLTADGSDSAHYENTILITNNKPEILTQARS